MTPSGIEVIEPGRRKINHVFNTVSLSYFLIYVFNGSRTIAPKENCPPTLKLTLTLTGGEFSSGAIISDSGSLYDRGT